MKKFLIVGVGGSGGATLRYTIDQLRADLRVRGVESLPASWQFVHIDVNPVPERSKGLGDIKELGGRYVNIGSAGTDFSSVRNSVEHVLSSNSYLEGLVGWNPLPRRQSNQVNVSEGAGQYRAVGRMLTLTSLKPALNTIREAWEDLQQPTPWGELPSAFPEEEPYSSSGTVYPIVVGSMAGGTGASMFLDVCRIMGRINGIERTNLGVFLFTPDVFGALSESARQGIDGNAIAALGELISAQLGSGNDLDSQLFKALGYPPEAGDATPFGRVFPIGAYVGGDGARFGANPDDIFRGLGRALAGTIISESAASQYQWTGFQNPAGEGGRAQTVLGWGPSSLAASSWGSYGYASLSLGRDRYAHYAAQRLARHTVDSLTRGYLNPASRQPADAQLDNAVDNQWGVILDRLGLPALGVKASAWLKSKPLPARLQNEFVISATSVVSQQLEDLGDTAKSSEWMELAEDILQQNQKQVKKSIDTDVYSWAEKLAAQLELRMREEVLRILAHPKQGLPYARRVIERLEKELLATVENLRKAPTVAPLQFSDDLTGLALVAKLDPHLKGKAKDAIKSSAGKSILSSAAKMAAEVLDGFVKDVLPALKKAVNHAHQNLDAEIESQKQHDGIAQLHTGVYNEWPENSDHVPPRFNQAQNEVLLTTSAAFPDKFEQHVRQTSDDDVFQSGLERMTTAIAMGRWENIGSVQADYSVVEQLAQWRAAVLKKDSESGDPTPMSQPRYRLALSTDEILDRSLDYQARQDQPFALFSNETFEGYLNEPGISDSVKSQRTGEMVTKFHETIKQAYPLVGINKTFIPALHGDQMKVELHYSTVPLSTPTVQRLAQSLEGLAEVTKESRERFVKAVKENSQANRIAVYSSYPHYSPLAYTPFFTQLFSHWNHLDDEGKDELWKWKRTRPIPGAVAMSSEELDAMVKGWYLGRGLGLVSHSEKVSKPDQPVEVFNFSRGRSANVGEWIKFPPRMLTSVKSYKGANDSRRNLSLLPGILEGYVLALIDPSNENNLHAMRPYLALRGVYDNRDKYEDTGSPTSGFDLLVSWIRDGKWPSGAPSQIAAIANAENSPEGRAAAILNWLSSVRVWIEDEFLSSEKSAAGEVWKLRIESTEELDEASLFSELALVVHDSLSDLEELAERALIKVNERVEDDAPQV